MTVYSQSSFDVEEYIQPHNLSSNSSTSSCSLTTFSYTMFSIYALLNCLLLPLCILILHMGFQRWRRQRSVPAGATTSHSDVFTYHMNVLNFFSILGSMLLFIEADLRNKDLFAVGHFFYSMILPGHTLMHCLTCLDLYLAVVHPVTYMRLRQTDWVRARNVILGCAWLLLFGAVACEDLTSFSFEISTYYSILLCVLFYVTLFAIVFFCISVICVLVHPRPGETGGHNDKVDKSKQRALRIILVLLAALSTECVPLLCTFVLYQMGVIDSLCYLLDCFMFLTLPSSLILPLLFLHKAGKLKCCRKGTESG